MNTLKSRRAQSGLTQLELAERVGCSLSQISAIETDKTRPSVPLAKKLGELLEFDWTLLFDNISITQNVEKDNV